MKDSLDNLFDDIIEMQIKQVFPKKQSILSLIMLVVLIIFSIEVLVLFGTIIYWLLFWGGC